MNVGNRWGEARVGFQGNVVAVRGEMERKWVLASAHRWDGEVWRTIHNERVCLRQYDCRNLSTALAPSRFTIAV